jgi:predicted enzyme related to lactoylglutathione lyase
MLATMIAGVRLIVRNVGDLDALHDFYERALGLQIAHQREWDVVRYEVASGSLFEIARLGQPNPIVPAEGPETVLVFQSDDFENDYRRAVEAGSVVVREPHDLRVLRIAYLKDPAGGTFAIAQPRAEISGA